MLRILDSKLGRLINFWRPSSSGIPVIAANLKAKVNLATFVNPLDYVPRLVVEGNII
jgi:hypothetical protein